MSVFIKVDKLIDPRINHSLKIPLSFTLQADEMLSITGENGSGKTTLLHFIAGLMEPRKGTVQKTSSLFYCGHKIGLKPSLRVWDNLKFRAGIYGHINDRQIEEALSIFGLAEKKYHFLEILSYGQQRLVALASAIFSPHHLWVLDEPFSNLDDQARIKLQRVLETHTQKGGAVILSTHQPITFGKRLELSKGDVLKL